jgi:hypothetical protein
MGKTDERAQGWVQNKCTYSNGDFCSRFEDWTIAFMSLFFQERVTRLPNLYRRNRHRASGQQTVNLERPCQGTKQELTCQVPLDTAVVGSAPVGVTTTVGLWKPAGTNT